MKSCFAVTTWLLVLSLVIGSSYSIFVDSDSHEDIFRNVGHLVVPSSLLSSAPRNTFMAAKIIGQATVAVCGNGEDVTELGQMLRWYAREGSRLLTENQLLFNATAEWLRHRATTHKEAIEKRLDYLRLQSNYISQQVLSLGPDQSKKIRKRSIEIVGRQNRILSSRVSDLHSTVDTGFVATQREIRKSALKMATQVQKLREDSIIANQDVKRTLEEIDGRLEHVDSSLGHFQTDTLESLAELSKEMSTNSDEIVGSIENLRWAVDENYAVQAETTAQSSRTLIARIDHLSSHIDDKFMKLDQSISDSEVQVTNKIDHMREELQTQLGQLARGVKGIGTELAAFNRRFEIRMDKLQNTVNKVQLTLDQYTLKSHIDEMKGLVNAWLGLMMTVVGELSGELRNIKVARFKQLCIRHDPLSVLTWIKRNIYDTVRGSVTRISPQNFADWQEGVVTLRNSAFVMYSACIHSQNVSHQVIEGELMHRLEQFLADNFLQNAYSVQQLHYAQWWRKHIAAITTVSERNLKTELENHKDWIHFELQLKEKVTVLNVRPSADTTPSITELIKQTNLSQPQQDLLFCCELGFEVCHQRSEGTKHHVCFGKTVLMRNYSSGLTYLIHFWHKSASPTKAADNFFTAPNGVGFAVADMSQYGSTWNSIKDIVNVHVNSQEVHQWSVILTDNICWWKQKDITDCTENQCDWQENVQVVGPIMQLIAVENKEMCCAMCAGTRGCLAVSWRSPDMCVLYDRLNKVVKKNGWTTASKLKDCTQCTNSLASDCTDNFYVDDRIVINAQFESHQNVSSVDCAQRCVKASPHCTSYSWYLTKDGSFCQLNDQHGMMENRIGSTIHYAPTSEEQCGIHKSIADFNQTCQSLSGVLYLGSCYVYSSAPSVYNEAVCDQLNQGHLAFVHSFRQLALLHEKQVELGIDYKYPRIGLLDMSPPGDYHWYISTEQHWPVLSHEFVPWAKTEYLGSISEMVGCIGPNSEGINNCGNSSAPYLCQYHSPRQFFKSMGFGRADNATSVGELYDVDIDKCAKECSKCRVCLSFSYSSKTGRCQLNAIDPADTVIDGDRDYSTLMRV